ncbi:hypothetical protein Ais01nite_13260 [Asanoa ishikariensis]|nr:hypothetical protein Ais01nite_13260 [Asanoa ishikariensis]
MLAASAGRRYRARSGAMPNGRPGDHLLTDITVHELEVFGTPCDDLIREISRRGALHAISNRLPA